jgi:hypothetical protein
MEIGIHKAARRAELVEVAAAMIEGRMHLIEGVRKINALRFDVEDPDAAVFLPIRAVDSETGTFPMGDVRRQCAPDYLRRVDQEIDQYLEDAKEVVLAACGEIVRRYSGHH